MFMFSETYENNLVDYTFIWAERAALEVTQRYQPFAWLRSRQTNQIWIRLKQVNIELASAGVVSQVYGK